MIRFSALQLTLSACVGANYRQAYNSANIEVQLLINVNLEFKGLSSSFSSH